MLRKLLFLGLLFSVAPLWADSFMFYQEVKAPVISGGGGGGCNAAGTAISSVSANVSAAGNSVNRTVTKPSGTTTDDVLVASVEIEQNTLSITPPSGWELIMSTKNVSTSPDVNVLMYYLRAGGSEPANYTWTFANSWNSIGITTYRYVNTGCGPLDSTASSNTFTSSGSMVAKSITTGNTNSMTVFAIANYDGTNHSCPVGHNENFDSQTIAQCAKVVAAAGATGDFTATGSSSTGAVGHTSLVD